MAPKFQRADWCPIARNDKVDCLGDPKGGAQSFIPEERHGSESRCFEASVGSEDRSLCLTSHCDAANRALRVSVGDQSFICDSDFETLSFVSSSGTRVELRCPRLTAVCPDMFCPGNCAGKGVCDFSRARPKCACFDENDASPGCFDSLPSSADVECEESGVARRHKLSWVALASIAHALLVFGWGIR